MLLDPIRARRGTNAIVVVSRLLHGLIAVMLLASIGVVYVGAWRGRLDTVTAMAATALGVEATLVSLSGWDCPLRPLFRWLGDDRPLFELVMPAPAARRMMPILGSVAGLGMGLLGMRTV